jgi:hypothetical protein
MRGLAVFVVALVAVLLSSERADACACCDGWSRREPVGWNGAGDRLLVRAEQVSGCERTMALEVWRVGATWPEQCYDLLAKPSHPVACDALTKNPDKPAGASSGVARYRVPIRSIAPSALRVVYRRENPGVEDGRVGIDVAVEDAGGFAPLAHVDTNEHFYSPGSDAVEGGLIPLEVAVLPAPKGDHAALFLLGDNLVPGVGHRGATIHWVVLKGSAGTVDGFIKVQASLVVDVEEIEPRAQPPGPLPIPIDLTSPTPERVEVVQPKARATGCGCSVPAREGSGGALLALATLPALRRRRGRSDER